MARRNFRIKRTFCPVSKPNCPHFAAAQAAAAAYAFFVNNPVTRKCFVGIVFPCSIAPKLHAESQSPQSRQATRSIIATLPSKNRFSDGRTCVSAPAKNVLLSISPRICSPPFVQLSFRLRNLFSETFFLFVSPVFSRTGLSIRFKR